MRPNIILITTDQQRLDSISAYGSRFMHTPNMNRIANEGAIFQRAYCPNTICTPSRVSMMTGQHLSRHGAYNIGTFAPDYSSFLSFLLQEHGYTTKHIGKAHWHPYESDSPESLPVDSDGTPFKDFVGFESAELTTGHGTWGMDSHYGAWLRKKGVDPESFSANLLFEDDYNETGEWEISVELHYGTWIAERTVEFLRQQNHSKPFFLNIGFPDPHHPHLVPFDFKERVDPETVPLPDINLSNETGTIETIPHFRAGTLPTSRFNGKYRIAGNGDYAWESYFKDKRKSRMTRAYYYSMVQLIDRQLGYILQALDDHQLSDNTILIFTTDHGEMLGDHCIGQKGPLVYEEVTHIPLLIRYPNGFSPCKVEECVSLVDLLPTILEFVDIQDQVRRDGRSLKPLLQKHSKWSRPGVRIEYKEEPDKIRYKCWVTKDWKLAVYPGEEFGELYNLNADPKEMHNLYDSKEHQVIKARLMCELIADMERSEPCGIRTSRV